MFVLTSRLALRRCRGRRFISSEAPDKVQSHGPHVPVSTDFGGIRIQASPLSRRIQRPPNNYPITLPVEIGDFTEGDTSKRFARANFRKRAQDHATSSASYARKYNQSPQWQGHAESPRMDQSPSRRDLIGEHGSVGQGNNRHRQRWRQTETNLRPDDMMQTRRMFRPGSGSSPKWRRRPRFSRRVIQGDEELADEELVDENAEDDEGYVESHDYITTIEPRRLDPHIPRRAPPPPAPLTNLETCLNDKNAKGLRERVGGDYKRYFPQEEWTHVRAQTVSSLGVLDRAQLALNLNGSMKLGDRKICVELVKKTVGKNASA